MKKINWLLLVFFAAGSQPVNAQSKAIDSVRFFTDDKLIEMTLTTDIKKLQAESKLDVYQDASVNMRFPDSTVADEAITVCARGHFRRENCSIPPMTLNFHNPGAPILNKLGKLKLVIGCGTGAADEQLILKEYLAYKIYNLLENKSFRVRLVKVNYRDTRNKIRPFTQFAFFIEDDNDMARRNGCVKREKLEVLTQSTNREMMTKVAVFEYMISNGDWSVPNNHNVKLIFNKKNLTSPPYVVPYDFDHSGLVNAGYAVPNEVLGTESVTERVYRGFPRTMEELQPVLDIFRQKKASINSLIMGFDLIKEKTRKEIIRYLEDFYETINDKHAVQATFINNARTQ